VKRGSLLALVLLVACSPAPPPSVLVVFAPGADGDALSAELATFSDRTGIPLAIHRGSSADITDRLIGKAGEPADVLITDNVIDIWRAAERGALRPIVSGAFDAQPDSLKDPDGFWAAIEARPFAILVNGASGPAIVDLDDLGAPQYAGSVCLSTSSLPANRALLAYLIDARGLLETERLVRRWVRNLAQPPFATDAELLGALQSGACRYAIAAPAAPGDDAAGMRIALPMVDITAIGINRHATSPEAALVLVDWLLDKAMLQEPGAGQRPTAAVRVAGWHDEEAGLLAERAGYR